MQRASQYSTILNWLLAAAASGIVVFTATAIVRGYSPTPYADSWNPLMSYQDFGFRVTLESLTMFHNEHRPLFARLPILADLFWLGGRGLLPLALIFAIQAGHAFLLWTIARKQTWFQKDRDRIPVIALAVFCCFSPAQMQNFLWTFQTAFVLTFLFATGAVAAVAAQKQKSSPKWAAAVFLCSVGATFCLASGVLVWWVVVATSIVLRLPKRWTLLCLAAAIATPIFYFQGYVRPSAHTDPLVAIRRPADLAHYVAFYFGYSWNMWSVEFGELLAIGVILFALIRVMALLRSRPENSWEAVPVLAICGLFGTAILTALGRLGLGLDQAGSGRYQTPALEFWFMAALLALGSIPKGAVLTRLAFCSFLLVAMITPFAAIPSAFERVEQHRRGENMIGAAWVSGVEDREVMPEIHSIMPLVPGYLERKLSVFGLSPGLEVGNRLASNRFLPANACEGRFHRETFVQSVHWPGIRLRGSARRASDGVPIDRFLTTGLDLRVIGVGAGDTLYANVKNIGEPFIVYGLLADGNVCAIALE
jgi:hypothetical protein